MFATSSYFTHFGFKSIGRVVTLTRTSIAVSSLRAATISVQIRKKSLFKMSPKILDDGYSSVAPNMSQGMAMRMKQIVDVGREGRRLIVGCDGMFPVLHLDLYPNHEAIRNWICSTMRC
jgi:hypothetical protein